MTLAPDSHRGGLLRNSVLSVVAATGRRRSSRESWCSATFRRAAVASPSGRAGARRDNVAANLPMRQRLAAHRNAVCASCHRTIDPVGFSLENFNAIGQWRETEVTGSPSTRWARCPAPRSTEGHGLEDALLSRPELFATTLTENLLTFALGRGVEHYDAPAVRKIVRESAAGRIPVVVAHSRNRQERSVSNAPRATPEATVAGK